MARKIPQPKAGRAARARQCVDPAAAGLPVTPVRIRLRHLQPLGLALLARQPGCGYDVMAALSALPMFAQARPDAPGVYRTLQAFEKRGLILGRRMISKKGPARREYTLTPAGRACLSNWYKTLESARAELDAVMALVQQGCEQGKSAAGARSGKPAARVSALRERSKAGKTKARRV